MFGKPSNQLFISYQHQNKEIAARLERALTSSGFDVWWDERLQTGQKWNQEIDRALLSAAAVIVLWSRQAVNSEWVRHEASIAKVRNVLTHAVIDEATAPELFSAIQCSDLSKWNGREDDPVFSRFTAGIRALIRKNRFLRWYRTVLASLSIALIALLLIYAGYRWEVQRAGPQNVIERYDTTADYHDVTLNLEELGKFYSRKDWDLAVICHVMGADIWSKENANFAFIPIGSESKGEYRIEFHSDMAESLRPIDQVECLYSVVDKSKGLTSFSPPNADGSYRGLKWSEATVGKTISKTRLKSVIENVFNDKKDVDVCACGVFPNAKG